MKHTFTLPTIEIRLTDKEIALFLTIAESLETVDSIALSTKQLGDGLAEMDITLSDPGIRRGIDTLEHFQLIDIKRQSSPRPSVYSLTSLGNELIDLMASRAERGPIVQMSEGLDSVH